MLVKVLQVPHALFTVRKHEKPDHKNIKMKKASYSQKHGIFFSFFNDILVNSMRLK